jgi:hypothetical protein
MDLLQLIPLALLVGLLAGIGGAGQTGSIRPPKRLHTHSGGEP